MSYPLRVQLDLPFLRTSPAPEPRVEFVRMRRARKYILRVRPDGTLRVTIPRGGSQRAAEAFVAEHRRWVDEERVRVASRYAPVERYAGETVPLRGVATTITIEQKAHRRFVLFADTRVRVAAETVNLRPAVETALRQIAARELISPAADARGRARPDRRAREHPQPAIAMGLVFDERGHRAQLPARADAALGQRLRPAARADAPAPAESLPPLSGGSSSRSVQTSGPRKMAPGRRQGAVLMGCAVSVVCLRRWRAKDTGLLVQHANNMNVARYLRDRFPYPYTRRDARAFLAGATGAGDRRTNLAIDVEGEAVGGIGFITAPTSNDSPPRSATGSARRSGAAAS